MLILGDLLLYRYKDKHPHIHESCFIAPSADIIGDVEIAENSSVWFSATIRADQNYIRIGKNVSVQDNAVLHVDDKNAVVIAEDVVIGHGAIIHGCKIDSNCIVGMGAIVLSGVEIGKNCIIGAGSVITEEKKIPDNSIVLGIPGKVVKQTTDEHVTRIKRNVQIYVAHNEDYKKYFEKH